MELFNTYETTLHPLTMKTAQNEENAGTYPCTGISLQQILDKLVGQLPGTIAMNKIVVENEVPSGFKMMADQNQVVPVIDEVLTTVMVNARNTSIFITAEKFTDTVTLSFEDRNNYNGYALAFSLMSIGQQARFIGGDINIDGAQKRVATVSFSFPDSAVSKRYH
jgi:hypothetical protein